MVAILVVGLIVVFSTGMLGEHNLNLKRMDNRLNADQAYLYLLSGEKAAQYLLNEDAKDSKDNPRDDESELWAQPIPPQPVGHGRGYIEGEIFDQEGLFNINNLAQGSGGSEDGGDGSSDGGIKEVPFNEHQRRFVRLLQTFEGLEISEAEAVEITEAVIDWLDGNLSTTGFGGMEDGEYQTQGLSYRVANGPMESVSELRLVGKISEPLYQALAPHVTVWPSDGGNINIHTATDNVLRSLNHVNNLQPLDLFELESLLQDRDEQSGFDSLDEFKKHSVWGGNNLNTESLVEESNVFLYIGKADIGPVLMKMESILLRNADKITVIRRSTSGL